MDVKDKKILFELENNARLSNKVIGKRIGVKPDLVRYRINNLVEEGIIQKFLTFVNFAKLGYTDYGVFVNTKKFTKEKEKEFVSFVKKNQNISFFSRVGGKYDFIIGILARNVLHFNQIFSEIMNKFGDYITKRDIATRVLLFHFSKDYLVDKKSVGGKMPKFGGEIDMVELDELDKDILGYVSTNARASVLDVSRELDIPASTIALRLKNLSKEGIIEGFFTFIDSSKYGHENYNLLVSFNKIPKEIENKFYEFCKSNPYVSWLIKTVGKWDYEVGVDVPDRENFQKLLVDIRENFSENLVDLDFVSIFEIYKYDLYPF